jgi:endonuclease/exonuclease/phosphatase family metal-dependent hydrolase
MSAVKKILIALISVIVIALLVVGIYLLYVILGYDRIDDQQTLAINRVENAEQTALPVVQLQTDEAYTAVTFNIGFGAYNHDFSFFLDEGALADGTPTVGSESRAASQAVVAQNTETVIAQALAEEPDIMLFQEVDVRADRSWEVDQVQSILDELPAGTWYDYATNFHTGFLFYPIAKPIGSIADSGLLTISDFEISSAERRSLPVSDAFPTKYFDLDRCISVSRLPVANAQGAPTGELVLINVHPSAYDEGGIIRAQQMELLADLIAAEYAQGNYVIVGGDFNHAFGGSESLFMNGMQQPPWVQAFDESLLPEGFGLVLASNYTTVATCRDTSTPYLPGVSYQVVLDGFIVSDNIRASAFNIDADYLGSDHNPVRLEFTLLGL